MQPATRRRAIIRNGVMAGSVWETRMKMDEVKGGIKVFNAAGESRDDEEGLRVYRRLRRNQSDGVDAERKKRKSWKQSEPQRSPIQLRKARTIEIGCKRGVEEKGVLLICDGKGNEKEMEEGEGDEEIDIEVEGRRRSFDDKEMDLPVEKEKRVEEVKKIEQIQEIQVSVTPMVMAEKKVSYVKDLKENNSDPVALSQDEEGEEEEDEDDDEILFEISSETSNKMQHIVDLVMWRDISKTAFAFGFGTFFLISSSYVKDLNFSLVSMISYLGLLYLAVIFIIRSILRRGEEAVEFEGCLVGEEEAIWILRRILPYLNELLLRTRALFSGDPATTMKMAVFLFVMGRCGSSITIWTLVKLAFFGVFTIPKVLSSYSVQLGRYGKFWLERFRDGWESCTHKKAIVAAIFTLIWNLSSTIARIWAVFMLVVAIRLYQQCMRVTWDEEDVAIEQNQQHHQQEHCQQQHHRQQQQNIRRVPVLRKSEKKT